MKDIVLAYGMYIILYTRFKMVGTSHKAGVVAEAILMEKNIRAG